MNCARDMQSLHLKLRDADIIVLATPAYVPLPGEMQNLVDRILPLMGTSLKNRNVHTRTRFHSNVKIRKLVQVSPSGWWDIGNFRTVLRLVKQLAKGFSVEFAGALLRPHSGWLTEDNAKTKKVLEAATQAGRQLAAEGEIPRDLLTVISQRLTSKPKWRH